MSSDLHFVNPPSFNYIHFNNTSSTISSPQTITYTSTSTANNWTDWYVNTGCVVQLNTNFPLAGGGAYDGLFTVNGTLICQTYTLTGDASCSFTLSSGASLYTANTAGVNGSISTFGTNTFNTAANYIFNGTAAQVTGTYMPAALVAPDTITIANSAGVTLSQATTSTGKLGFTAGTLNTGGLSFTLPGAATSVYGAGASSYVIGTLTKTISGCSTVNFEVGDVDYAPYTMSLSSAGTGGTLSVLATSGLHPSVSSSFIDPTTMCNHYWTVTNTGASGPTTVTPTLGYNATDILGGGSNSGYVFQEYTGGVWFSTPVISTNTSSPYTTTPSASIALATLAGDYICGNPTSTCSGAPTTGTASVSPSTGNATTLFALNLVGSTFALGISYQWQSSPTGTGGSWTNIPGATGTGYGFTGITSNTYYRCLVTCSTSSITDTSGSVEAVYMSCLPAPGTSWTNSFSNTFTYTGALQTWTVPTGVYSMNVDASGATGGGVNAYDTYQSIGGAGGRVQATLAVTPGHVLNVTVGGQGAHTAGTGGFGGGGSDGVFSAIWPGAGGGGASSIVDNTTTTKLLFAGGGGGGGGDIAGGDIGGAGGGLTGGAGVSASCTTGGLGGTQTAGGAGEVCTYTGGNGSAGTGGASAGTDGSGGGGGGYFGGGGGALGGGGGGGSSYTNSLFASAVTHTQGYNTAGNGSIAVSGYCDITADGINSLSVIGALSSTLTDTGIAAAVSQATGYANHTSITPVIMLQGGTYATSTTWGNALTYQEVQIWIDFNDNGTFESSETVTPVSGYSTSATPQPTTFSISIPSGANLGTHLMRVRGIQEDSTSTRSLSTQLDPCLTSYGSAAPYYLNGDIVDYYCNIQNSACSGTPTAGTVSSTASTGCTSYSSTLTLTGATTGAGITYQWQSSTDDATWTSISGATSSTYAATVSATTYYRCTITCTASSLSASTPGVLLTLPVLGVISNSGSDSLCVGGTTTLSDTTAGGTWASGTTTVATVNPTTGVVTGVAFDTAVITYSASGCSVTHTVYVIPGVPASITGSFSTCVGGTTSLSDATPGGTWTSGTTSVATIGSTTGVVSGASIGTSIITYSAGCSSTTVTVTVSGTPASITGTATVCIGGTTTLADATGGGTWTSVTPGTATAGSTTGIITGVAAGTVTIVYTTSCGSTSTVVTVNGSPAAITGTLAFCAGTTSTLADVTPSVSWSSSATGVATVDASGDVTGVSGGTATITCSNGCGTPATAVVTVTPLPSAIGGSLSVCGSGTTTLTDSVTGGTWISINTGVANIGSTTGIVSVVAPGTTTISYTTGCGTVTAVLTVNSIPPTAITGTTTVCQGAVTTLADAVSGGSWSSSNTAIATVDAFGDVTGVSGGSATITYSTGCGSPATVSVSVTPLPSVITGSSAICVATTETLSDSLLGGTWSTTGTVASIDASLGVVTALAQGTQVVTYTTGCGSSTAAVTVYAAPSAITGAASVCIAGVTSLADAALGGTWTSGTTSVATVDGSGNVTGVSLGTSVITYSNGCGTAATITVTVSNAPAPIAGTLSVCSGSVTTLTNAAGGGTWSSTTTGVATVDGSGDVTGVSVGTSTISYTTGCGTTTAVVTVNAVPSAIFGTFTVCAGSLDSLMDTTAGGTFSSSVTGVAIINSTTGSATGVAAGTTTISYTLASGCGAAAVLTVNPLPNAGVITGSNVVCAGSTITLADTAVSGTTSWSSSNGTASVSGGIVTGVAAGTDTIYYSLTNGCGLAIAALPITVNAPADAGIVSGTNAFCLGMADTMFETISGGSWTSSNTGVATIDPATGIMTSVAAGTTNITYTVITSCGTATTTGYAVTVNATPAAITGTFAFCAGTTSTLACTTAGGTWSSADATVATVDASGDVYGVAAGFTTITYANMCGSSTAAITVNGVAASISGTPLMCVGDTMTFTTPVTGGTWSSGTPAVASIGTGGLVTALTSGVTTISYATVCGSATYNVTVNAVPGAISGTSTVCTGSIDALSIGVTGGTWTSNNNAVATVDAASGSLTGIAPGVDTINYANGCGVGATFPVTVLATPSAITGPMSLCVATSISLSDSAAGGTWSGGTTGVATIDVSGHVTGSSAGTVGFTYTTGCGSPATYTVTVNPLPAAISGATSVCQLSSVTISDASGGGGSWSSSDSSIAIASPSGVVTGYSGGTVNLTYTLPTGCYATESFTVNALPDAGSINGPDSVCVGATITVTDTAYGGMGTWVSGTPSKATVSGGVITGVSAGTVTINYSVTYGCGTGSQHRLFYVRPLPVSGTITGGSNLCVGTVLTLADTATGGTWSSTTPSVATVVGGHVTGVSTGVDTIQYTVTNYCGTSIAAKVVNVLNTPSAIGGSMMVCVGSTDSLTNSSAGGTWTSGTTTVGTIGATSGLLTGVSAGTTLVTYSTGCGAAATAMVTVNALPNAGTISGQDSLCATASVTLSETATGGTWGVSNPNASITSGGVLTGVAGGLDTVIYSVTSSFCGSNIATMTVTINALPVAGTLFGTDSVCVGATVTLTPTSTGGVWSISNANAGVAGGMVNGVTAGMDTVTYTVTSLYCGAASVTQVMNIIPLANPGTISGIATVCAGANTTLSESVAGGTWNVANAAVATVSGGVVSGISAGTDTVMYTVSNYCGFATATDVVTVNTLPNPGTITGTDSVCVGATVSLSDLVTSGTWTSGTAAVASISATGVVTGVAAGVDSVSYAVTNGCGTSTAKYGIKVLALPVSGTISGHPGICTAGFDTLTASVPGGTWSSQNTAVALVASGIAIGEGAGIDTVMYMVTNSCGTATAKFVLEVDSVLNPAISGYPYVCIVPGKTDTLFGTPAGGAWIQTNMFDTIGAATGVLTGGAGGNGMDTVTYTVANYCGSFSATSHIMVYTKHQCDSIDYVAPVMKANGTVTVYPNPSDGMVTVEVAGTTGDATVEIVDMYGNIVLTGKLEGASAAKGSFNLAALPSGTYLVRVNSENGTSVTKLQLLGR